VVAAWGTFSAMEADAIAHASFPDCGLPFLPLPTRSRPWPQAIPVAWQYGQGVGRGFFPLTAWWCKRRASYSYNTSNELTSNSAATFTYDNNGNTLSKTDSTGTRNCTWDFENRLASVVLPSTAGTVTFKYDPFGRRIQKAFTQNSTTTVTNYLYDGANIIEELGQSGNEIARYAQSSSTDQPLSETRAGATSYYAQDGIGSITSLSSSTGTLSNTYTYDAFGNLTASTGSLTNPFRYTGRDFDQETGLYYLRARYLDPAAGRFLSEDPISFGGGLNFYTYVDNSPIGDYDPTGNARCMYVINGAANGNGWLQCTPDNPKNTGVSFQAASGNNSDANHNCKNNPDCADKKGIGPIPPGWYTWTGKIGSHKHNGTLLEPIPGSLTDMHDRNGILTHFCANPFGLSLSPKFCSEGCITANEDDINALNQLLTAEPGSILYVTAIDKPAPPPVTPPPPPRKRGGRK
jgi:RHS repeat-associated protein